MKLLFGSERTSSAMILSSFTASMLTKVTTWEKIVQWPLKRA